MHGGNRIEDWRPELDTDLDFAFAIPGIAVQHAHYLLKDTLKASVPYAALYFSSVAWNEACTKHQGWYPSDWARLCIKLQDRGIQPVILGSEWDIDYRDRVAQALTTMHVEPDNIWLDLTGQTPLTVAMAIMRESTHTAGICSGLPFLAAHSGWPTIIFWPEDGILPRPVNCRFKKEFQTNWLPQRVLDSGKYTPLSIGTFTWQDVYDRITAGL